jgi:putative peptidoglycan lipid II flippase
VVATNEIFRAPHGTNVNLHPSVHAVEWLNISTSLSYVVGAIVGHILLTRQLGLLGFRAVGSATARIGLASAVGAGAAYGVVLGMEHVFGKGHVGELAALALGGLVGLAVLAGVAAQLRLPELQQLLALVRGREQ